MFKPLITRLLAVTLSFGLGASVFAAVVAAAEIPQETKKQHDARMDWFRQAKFGMFIHWGVYSVPAGEWEGKKDYAEWFLEQTKMPVSQYEKFRDQFNPVKFDAKKWVAAAKDAGVKYIVVTSKHHDGFAMFNTKLTDWGIMSTPYKRDPMKPLAAACKEAGIKFCFYHSIMDWHHPDYRPRRLWNDVAKGAPDFNRYVEFMKGQLKELLTNYGPIGVLWFDGEWEDTWAQDRGKDLYAYVRSLQPNIIVNNRVGKNRSGMAGLSKGDDQVGDYGTPEQEIPAGGLPGVDWESCMTMNDHWGYNKNDQNWKSPTTLIRNLIDIASKGGNYLLNVGPTAEGLIPEPGLQRLAEIGKWMKVNGQSIYGTTAGPLAKAPAWGRVTQKRDMLYLHVFDWPTDGKLVVPPLKAKKVTAAYLLSDPDCSPLVATINKEGGIDVTLRGPAPDPIASVVVLEITQ
jgi:alpha-L-fucosidase